MRLALQLRLELARTSASLKSHISRNILQHDKIDQANFDQQSTQQWVVLGTIACPKLTFLDG